VRRSPAAHHHTIQGPATRTLTCTVHLAGNKVSYVCTPVLWQTDGPGEALLVAIPLSLFCRTQRVL